MKDSPSAPGNSGKGPADDRSGGNDSSQKTGQATAVGLGKEQESQATEEKILKEIIQTSEAADEQAEKEVKEQLVDAKLSQPAPAIPPDLVDAGVKSPQLEADSVIKKGSTIELPITEAEFRRGLHQKIASQVVNKVVFGVSGLVGLVAWVGRMIKIAHGHAVRVVFRKE